MKRLLVLPLFFLLLTGCIRTTSGGSHTGYITAVETNGIIFKADYVYIKTDLSSSQEDKYCIEDDDVLSQVKQAQSDKSKVTLKYHDELFYWPSRCHNGTAQGMVDSVEVNQ